MKERYTRYTSEFQNKRVNSDDRKIFETSVISEFMKLYSDSENLNVKADKKLFDVILNDIGYCLQSFAKKVASELDDYPGINEVLESNPVPNVASEIMTKEFRIFCLSLNALKQFISAEQKYMDTVLLGARFKKKIKDRIDTCTVTKEPLKYGEKDQVNFHHTMRDGRFPIPLSKSGHDSIENQLEKG